MAPERDASRVATSPLALEGAPDVAIDGTERRRQRPTDAAQEAELALQVMLTKGESVKAKPKEGMIGSYFERKVKLKVTDE